MNIPGDSTLKIEIINIENSESVCQESPNFLESLFNPKIEVNSVINFRWKKRSLNSDLSYPVSKRSRLDISKKSKSNPEIS